MQSGNFQCRYWIGTSFREDFLMPLGLITYGVHQKEMCPSSSRVHSQFFVVMPKRVRLSGMKKMFPGDHLEPARDPRSAREYCMKVETRLEGPWEVGTWEEPGLSVDTEKILDLVKKRRVLDVIAEQPKLWRNLRVLSDLRSSAAPVRSTLTKGVLFTGSTGCGKTKIARLISEYVGTEETFWHNGTKWWNNYDQQELVVFDEFRGNWSAQEILRVFDRVPYQVEYKGGFAQFNSNLVLLTSNLDFDAMYGGLDPRTLAAIKRRVLVVNF